jgi:hypothetical protein
VKAPGLAADLITNTSSHMVTAKRIFDFGASSVQIEEQENLRRTVSQKYFRDILVTG